MDIENLPEELFEFIGSKEYEELSFDEKRLVDATIGSEDYKAYKDVIGSFKKADGLLERSIAEPGLPLRKSSVLTNVIYYRIPLYQVAAAFAILFGSLLLWKNNPSEGIAQPNNSNTVVESGKTLNKDHYPDDLVFNL